MGYSRKLKRLQRKSRKYKGGRPNNYDIMDTIRKMLGTQKYDIEGNALNITAYKYKYIPLQYKPYDILKYIRNLKLLSLSSDEDKKILSDISRDIIYSSKDRMSKHGVKSSPNAVSFINDSTILCEAKKLGLLLDTPFPEQVRREAQSNQTQYRERDQPQGMTRTNQATLLQGSLTFF